MRQLDALPKSLRAALARRGLVAGTSGIDPARLLVPSDGPDRERMYGLLARYSFRLLLRDVLIHRRKIEPAKLEKYCSRATVSRYLRLLTGAGILEALPDGTLRVARASIDSFGETLEWLVAEILRREFGFEVACSVRLRASATGGDFDVLASAEGRLVYVETKAAPPRHVHRRHVRAFVDRIEALRPTAAILLEDTTLRMTDKLVVMLEEELSRRRPDLPRPFFARLERETFAAADRLFVTNTAPNLRSVLARCLNRVFRAQEGAAPSTWPRLP